MAERRKQRVLYVQATDPAAYPPLLHSGKLLAEHGHRVRYLSAPVAGRVMRVPEQAGLDVEHVAERATHVMDPVSYARYLAATVRCAWRFRPDLVYASDPMGALPGLIAARLVSARLIYHEHDSPNTQHALNPWIRRARRRALHRARWVIFPNGERASVVMQETGFPDDRLRVIWNMPGRDEVPPPATRSVSPLVVYYHGSISPERLPLSVLEAVLQFGGAIRLAVAGYETTAGHMAMLAARAASAGLPETLVYHGELPERADLARCMAEAHIGLALMPMATNDLNMRHMTGASNKAFDYLAGGLALLVSDLPDWRSFFADQGYGRSCDPGDPASVATALRWFLEHPDAMRDMALRGRQRIVDEWNYDAAFVSLLQEMELA